MPVSQPDVHHT